MKLLVKSTGFTLLELLVSFSIISLLLFIGLPIHHSITDGVALDSQSQQIVNDLRLAQQRSLVSQGGVNHGIHFNTTDYVLFGNAWASPTYTITRQLSRDIQITQGADSEIIFSRLTGVAADKQITITLPNGKQRIITITKVGGITTD